MQNSHLIQALANERIADIQRSASAGRVARHAAPSPTTRRSDTRRGLRAIVLAIVATGALTFGPTAFATVRATGLDSHASVAGMHSQVRVDRFRKQVRADGFRKQVRGDGFRKQVRADGFRKQVRGDGFRKQAQVDGFRRMRRQVSAVTVRSGSDVRLRGSFRR